MDRKKMILSIFLLLLFLFLNSSAQAHPGRTSSDGCHYCRTNCDSWGYTYGTRHNHYGNSCSCNPPVDPLYCSPPPTNTPIPPTPTFTPIPTFTPSQTPTETPTPVPTDTPSPTDKTAVLGETTTKPPTTTDNLIGLGIMGGIGIGVYKIIKKVKNILLNNKSHLPP